MPVLLLLLSISQMGELVTCVSLELAIHGGPTLVFYLPSDYRPESDTI